jgi:hypothetical protein
MAIDRINATALLDGGVTTADIADDAVTTAKIAAGQVTSAKLDTNISVTGDLLVDNYTLYVDSANNRVGLGTGLPTTALTLGTSQTATVQNGGSTSAPAYGITSGALGVNGTYVPAANTLGFVVGGGERGRFTANGLTFNGDTAAANALDDYEEGTWTAQIIGSTTNPSTAVTMPTATYTKIGRLVFAQFQFSNVNTTGASGGVRVSGLPFTSTAAHGTGNILTYVGMTFPTTSTNISPYVSGTQISFYYSTSNQGWSEITHNATSGVYLAVTVTYQTNA